LVLVLKKYGGLGLGLETQSHGLGLCLDKKVLFGSLPICSESAIHTNDTNQPTVRTSNELYYY